MPGTISANRQSFSPEVISVIIQFATLLYVATNPFCGLSAPFVVTNFNKLYTSTHGATPINYMANVISWATLLLSKATPNN